jgi:NAD(P)H-flavin reductase
MTNYFMKLKEGDHLQIQAPLGRFVLKKPFPQRIAFVATGTGIAPFRAMIFQLLKEGTDRDLWLIFGNRYETDILYDEEWKELAEKHSNFHYVPTVSRPKTWTGEKEYVQGLLPKYLKTPADTHVYICGLTNMINEVQKTALEMGFTKEQVFFEKYD